MILGISDNEPTVVDRQLGFRVRCAMTEAGLRVTNLAEQIGCPANRLSRQLAGYQRLSVADVTAILTLCGWSAGQQEPLRLLCESGGTRNVIWLEPDEVYPSLRAYIRELAHAVQVAPVVLPWTVQTHDYARQLALATGAPRDQLSQCESSRASWRVRWQDAKTTTVLFLHEQALRTPVGSARVMAKQLAELTRLANLPGLSLRIVQAGKAHAAMQGAFTLLEFPKWRPLVYQSHGDAGLLAGTTQAIATAQRIKHRLDRHALDERQSCELINQLSQSIQEEVDRDHKSGIVRTQS